MYEWIPMRRTTSVVGALSLIVVLFPFCAAGDAIRHGFVDVKEYIPSIVVEMRYYGSHNFVGQPIDGYKAPRCLLTEKAAKALKEAQRDLERFSFSLKVYDCYRPQRAVDYFVSWARDIGDKRTKKEFYPTIDKGNLFKYGYIAAQSTHSRGSTVDLTIVPVPVPEQEEYRQGQELFACFLPEGKRFRDNSIDMGTGFDCFHIFSQTTSSETGILQRSNRLLLRTLMEKHGFVNSEMEWWHFTLKDEPYPDTYFDFVVE